MRPSGPKMSAEVSSSVTQVGGVGGWVAGVEQSSPPAVARNGAKC